VHSNGPYSVFFLVPLHSDVGDDCDCCGDGCGDDCDADCDCSIM